MLLSTSRAHLSTPLHAAPHSRPSDDKGMTLLLGWGVCFLLLKEGGGRTSLILMGFVFEMHVSIDSSDSMAP